MLGPGVRPSVVNMLGSKAIAEVSVPQVPNEIWPPTTCRLCTVSGGLSLMYSIGRAQLPYGAKAPLPLSGGLLADQT